MSLHPHFSQWRDKLDALLKEAGELAAGEADPADRLDLKQRLHRFILENPDVIPGDPATEVFGEMDEIARRARDALSLADISARVDSIAGRTFELGELEKLARNRAARNEVEARKLRLEKATRVVSSLTDSIHAIRDLKVQLETSLESDEDFGELTTQLAATLDSLQALRTAIDSPG